MSHVLLMILSIIVVCTFSQQPLNYQKFIEKFKLNNGESFSQEEFMKTFFNQNQGGDTPNKEFNFEQFSKAYSPKDQNLKTFNQETFLKNMHPKRYSNSISKGQPASKFSQEDFLKAMKIVEAKNNKFDFNAFRKVFTLQQRGSSNPEVDYDAFLKALGVNSKKNIQKQFDNELFMKIFKQKQGQVVSQGFDYKKFAEALISKPKDNSQVFNHQESMQAQHSRTQSPTEEIFDQEKFKNALKTTHKAQASSSDHQPFLNTFASSPLGNEAIQIVEYPTKNILRSQG